MECVTMVRKILKCIGVVLAIGAVLAIGGTAIGRVDPSLQSWEAVVFHFGYVVFWIGGPSLCATKLTTSRGN
jgi:hypothetical protein